MKNQKMRPRTKINLIGIIVSLFIFGIGYSLYSSFSDNKKNEDLAVEQSFQIDNQKIIVRGESSEDESSEEKDEKISSVTAGKLFEENPDAPRKEDKYGNYYVGARSAIAIDSKTNTILFDQNAKKRVAIASLTKVMTAVLVVENIEDLKKEIVTIDKETIDTQGTVIGCPRSGYCVSNRLRVGEKISAWNLLEALLINSTNDAAVALARHIAGSEEEFVKIMNRKAKELGLQDTNFCNASGLDDENRPGGCYSTAYDIARISAYSLKHKDIWNIMKEGEKDIYSADGKIVHHIVKTVLLLDQMPNCIGGKTGFTYEAGKSLMAAAHHPQDKNRIIVAVVLDNNQRWEDMKNLINWVFSAYRWPI